MFLPTESGDAAPPATPDVRQFILGTAGHIDHGKTSLVRALTGTNPDRLPEEQRRGMTIELGFAELDLGDVRFGIVDVPGHERFVRTMVSGATGIDLALLVIASDDSVMPQTIEHLEILDLLDVHKGVVVLTKADIVDATMLELVAEETRDILRGTRLHDAPIVPVSSVTGRGLNQLTGVLRKVALGLPSSAIDPPFRLAVDRVFVVQGRGTVVTGSVQRGSVAVGETLEVWPGGHEVRVRGLHTHSRAVETVQRGQRAAINLIGLDRERLERGVELASPGYLEPSRLIELELRCARTAPRPLRSARLARLSLGTAEVPARVVLFDRQELLPGETAFAQLRCGQPLVSSFGQRLVLRDETASFTVGGGRVLRPVARRRRRGAEGDMVTLRALAKGSSADRLEVVLRDAAFVSLTDSVLSTRSGIPPLELASARAELQRASRLRHLPPTTTTYVPAALDDLVERLTHWLERYHEQHPELPGRKSAAVVGWIERMTVPLLAKPLLEELLRRGAVRPFGDFLCLPAFAPSLSAAEEKALRALVRQIHDGGFSPPTLDVLSGSSAADRKKTTRLTELAVALGELVLVESRMYLHREVEAALRDTVAGLVRRQGPATVAEIREALGSSRKYVVPFVEYLDRIGFTRRIGDRREIAAESSSESGRAPTGGSEQP